MTAVVSTGPLGIIYLPSSGTGVGEFLFVVDPENGSSVQIGTPVAADTTEGTVVGVVVDMSTIGTSSDPVREELGASYSSEYIADIAEVVVATVQVYASERMRPVRAGVVRAASREEMLAATGHDRMDWKVPAGVVTLTDGNFAKVCFDGEALLGPESAHLIVNGLSGQAAKTSYAGVLLRSAIAHSNTSNRRVAALVFNLKGDDLIHLDQPPTAGYELSETDRAMYEALDVPAEPFPDVEVWAPGLPGGGGTMSRRDDARPLRWDLQTVWPHLQYFFGSWFLEDEKIRSFLADFEDTYVFTRKPGQQIRSFGALDRWFGERVAEARESGDMLAWRTHHLFTLQRIWRMLSGLVARCRGLLSKEATDASEDIPVDAFRPGQVLVVDIAGLRPDVQSIVIARTLERALRQSEEGDLGVDNLVVFADELNQWAPASAPEAPQVRKLLQRVATQGRYAGISMWGACQKMSKVDELIRDNAATRAVGITADGELASGAFGRLSRGLTERLATLPKGQMALWHYTFRGAMVVSFPRPAWRTGKAKDVRVRSRAVDVLEVSDAGRSRLLEGIDVDVADEVVAAADDPVKALSALARLRQPDVSKVRIVEPNTVDPDDPFGIDDD